MKGESGTGRQWLTSIVLATPCFVAGWLLVPRAGSWDALLPILGAMLCFIVGACILAFPIAHAFSEPWGALYFSTRMPDGKTPMYGIPQSKRKKGEYEGAMAAYEAILAEYPTELRAYVEMMDLAVMDLRDVSRAERIYDRGLLAIQNEDDRRALSAMYQAISSRLALPRHETRRITLRSEHRP